MSDLDRVVATLRAAPSVAVLSHINPEGDAIGATLGAALALRGVGKVTAAYNASPLPPGLESLPVADEVLREVPIRTAYACYLVLDTSDLPRTGGLLDSRPDHAVVVNVDHHAANTRFGTVNWVDPEASSAGELVYRMLHHGGFPLSAIDGLSLPGGAGRPEYPGPRPPGWRWVRAGLPCAAGAAAGAAAPAGRGRGDG